MSDNRMEPATMDLSCQSSTHQPCSITPSLTAWRQNISNPWTDSGRPPWLWPQSWGTFGWWEFDVLVQGSTNWCASALVKFVPSVARLVCLTLLGSFLTMLCRPFCASLYVCNYNDDFKFYMNEINVYFQIPFQLFPGLAEVGPLLLPGITMWIVPVVGKKGEDLTFYCWYSTWRFLAKTEGPFQTPQERV